MSQTDDAAVDQEFVEVLHQSADESASAILPYFRTNTEIVNKSSSDFDPVTAADRAAEQAIRDVIASRFPGHGIVGEEFGVVQAGARFQWVIDPIDGTRAFVQGLPTWGTLIAVSDSGKPVAGVMNQPFTRERFWSDGRSAFFRRDGQTKQRIRTRAASLGSAQMCTTDPALFAAGYEQAAFRALHSSVRHCRYGTDCYAYALVAAGHVDIVLESGLNSYDIAALIPIIEHAGGRVTNWAGGPAADGGRILACGDARLHKEVVDLLARAS
ncbi:MAG: histidinol-phosphatase [Hyphomicrobiales bacterium]|nr:histidinol-phosphatase [Hyphomicrobiales bacterium]